ncbi:unnamed protein product [Clonostachys byssicola]|uniref:Uncharacterized protein n=1 Tax=Clonostachys byssicola TaxID=160290 RepID=A0A9N9Y073_9HYPO|nr:unnamed protein product [Clonostachys byssicola]
MVAPKQASVFTIPLLLAASSTVAGLQSSHGIVSRSEPGNNEIVNLALRLDNEEQISIEAREASLTLDARAKLQKQPPKPKAEKAKTAQQKPAKLQKKPPQNNKPKIDISKISSPKLISSSNPGVTNFKSATQYHVPSYKGPNGKTVSDPKGWKVSKRSRLQRRAKLQKQPPKPKAEKPKPAPKPAKSKPAKLQKKPPQNNKPKIDISKISSPKLISSTHPAVTQIKSATQYHVPSYKGPNGKTVSDPKGWKVSKRSMLRRLSKRRK